LLLISLWATQSTERAKQLTKSALAPIQHPLTAIVFIKAVSQAVVEWPYRNARPLPQRARFAMLAASVRETTHLTAPI
jgi:hypothetical protein